MKKQKIKNKKINKKSKVVKKVVKKIKNTKKIVKKIKKVNKKIIKKDTITGEEIHWKDSFTLSVTPYKEVEKLQTLEEEPTVNEILIKL